MSNTPPNPRPEELFDRYRTLINKPATWFEPFTLRRAIQEFTRALPNAVLNLDRSAMHGIISDCWWRLGNTEKSYSAAVSAVIANGKSPYALNARAVAHLAKGRCDAALSDLQAAQSLAKPLSQIEATVVANLMEAHHRLGNKPKAYECLRSLASRERPDPLTLFLIASGAARMDSPFEAVEFLARHIAAVYRQARGNALPIYWIDDMPENLAKRVAAFPAMKTSIAHMRLFYDMPEESADGVTYFVSDTPTLLDVASPQRRQR
ncbi:MAG: bacterial transcriptional activator domain-containing protein [Deltaproteobacteria bacterium]|nr:bacterial transcriptional activator domain-containing protein [Deltaproteobacteria bacterium]